MNLCSVLTSVVSSDVVSIFLARVVLQAVLLPPLLHFTFHCLFQRTTTSTPSSVVMLSPPTLSCSREPGWLKSSCARYVGWVWLWVGQWAKYVGCCEDASVIIVCVINYTCSLFITTWSVIVRESCGLSAALVVVFLPASPPPLSCPAPTSVLPHPHLCPVPPLLLSCPAPRWWVSTPMSSRRRRTRRRSLRGWLVSWGADTSTRRPTGGW